MKFVIVVLFISLFLSYGLPGSRDQAPAVTAAVSTVDPGCEDTADATAFGPECRNGKYLVLPANPCDEQNKAYAITHQHPVCHDISAQFEQVNHTNIYTACQNVQSSVRSILKAPSTAVFAECEYKIDSKNNLHVTGTVDAQNAYGAMLRKSYSYSFTSMRSSWLPYRICFDGTCQKV